MSILFRVPLPVVVFALCVMPTFSSTTVSAEESIDHSQKARVIRLHPNGIDDTSALQDAFDSCSGSKGPCKIRLASGVFHTAPLVATNFHGAVRGAGQGVTVIRALTDRVLHLTEANPFYLFDPTPEEPWHTLVMFVEGNTSISDLTIHVPTETKTDGWWGACGVFKIPVLGVALGATSRDPMRFVVRNVSTIGGETGNADWPFSINDGMGVYGFMPGGSLDCTDVVPATGEFIFDSNHISTTLQGTDVWSVQGSNIRITRNTYEGVVLQAVQVWDASHSRVYIAYNDVSTMPGGTPISLLQNTLVGFGFPIVDGRSEYAVVDNHVTVENGFAGIAHFDNVAGLAPSRLKISHNLIRMGGNTFAGISLDRNTERSKVQQNKISGKAAYGVFVNRATACEIRSNDFSELAEEEADILLDEDTSNCRVQVFSSDTVEDLGTDNRVIFE